MAVFTNLLVLADPSGGSKASLGDDQIRNDKEAILARLALEHQDLISGTNDDTSATAMGRHKPPVTCVFVGTAEEIAAEDPFQGRIGFGTDTEILYIANGANWTTLTITGGAAPAVNTYAFLARHNGSTRTYNTNPQPILDWESAIPTQQGFDQGGCFTAGAGGNAGQFKAKVAGIYSFSMGVSANGVASGSFIEINAFAINANRFRKHEFNDLGSSRTLSVHISFLQQLAVGQTCQPYLDHNSPGTVELNSGDPSGTTYFCGHLVGAT